MCRGESVAVALAGNREAAGLWQELWTRRSSRGDPKFDVRLEPRPEFAIVRCIKRASVCGISGGMRTVERDCKGKISHMALPRPINIGDVPMVPYPFRGRKAESRDGPSGANLCDDRTRTQF